MDFSNLHGLHPYDPAAVAFPSEVVEALPADLRSRVDSAYAVLTRLEAVEIPEPLTATEVVRGVAVELELAAIEGKSFDWFAHVTDVVSRNDASAVALHARLLAIDSARYAVLAEVIDVVPEALAAWTTRVQEISVQVDACLGDGVVMSELDARRGSKADLERWLKLSTLLAEFDAIRSAFVQARYVVDRSDSDDRFTLSAMFKGVLESDRNRFSNEVQTSEHSLIAGIRLGWTPWCPTRPEQLADEQATIKTRRQGASRVTDNIHVG
jgi:hypothetical protein